MGRCRGRSRSRVPGGAADFLSLQSALVLGRCDRCPCQQFAQMPNVLPIKHVAVVRAMQDTLGAAQQDPQACAREGCDCRTGVMEQGFHVPSVNVATDGLVENQKDQVPVLVAHDEWVGDGAIRRSAYRVRSAMCVRSNGPHPKRGAVTSRLLPNAGCHRSQTS